MNRSQIEKRGPLCVACFDVFFSFLTHFFVSFLFFVFPFAWPVKFGFVSFHKIYWNSIPLVEIIWYISLLAQTLCTRGNLITFSIYISSRYSKAGLKYRSDCIEKIHYFQFKSMETKMSNQFHQILSKYTYVRALKANQVSATWWRKSKFLNWKALLDYFIRVVVSNVWNNMIFMVFS